MFRPLKITRQMIGWALLSGVMIACCIVLLFGINWQFVFSLIAPVIPIATIFGIILLAFALIGEGK